MGVLCYFPHYNYLTFLLKTKTVNFPHSRLKIPAVVLIWFIFSEGFSFFFPWCDSEKRAIFQMELK